MDRTIKKLEDELEYMKMELNNRPTVKDLHSVSERANILELRLRDKETESKGLATKIKEMSLIDVEVKTPRISVNNTPNPEYTGQLECLSKEQCVKLLASSMEAFKVRDPSALPSAFEKISRVLKALPNLQTFASQVCTEVFGFEDSLLTNRGVKDDRTHKDIIPILRNWKHIIEDCDRLKRFRSQLLNVLDIQS